MKIDVCPRQESGEIMFTVIGEDGTRQTYWKPWWRGHAHALRMIFAGHQLSYVEPTK